jgi:hypothetical protein
MLPFDVESFWQLDTLKQCLSLILGKTFEIKEEMSLA